MEDFKSAARRAKCRLKTGYWIKCREEAENSARLARKKGLNGERVKSNIMGRVISDVRGEKPDDFYMRVKKLLDECGEVSDAIGRLTDAEYFSTLSYEEKQRYTLELSARYLAALEKYRAEKEMRV